MWGGVPWVTGRGVGVGAQTFKSTQPGGKNNKLQPNQEPGNPRVNNKKVGVQQSTWAEGTRICPNKCNVQGNKNHKMCVILVMWGGNGVGGGGKGVRSCGKVGWGSSAR